MSIPRSLKYGVGCIVKSVCVKCTHFATKWRSFKWLRVQRKREF